MRARCILAVTGLLGGWMAATAGAQTLRFASRTIGGGLDGFVNVSVGDMTGDGLPDVVTVSTEDLVLALFVQTASGFEKRIVDNMSPQPRPHLLVDLDGDGDLDILVGRSSLPVGPGPDLAWYENDGAASPSFTERVIDPESFVASGVVASDLDGDGDLDVAATYSVQSNQIDETIAWYESDGGSPPSFIERRIETPFDGAGSLRTSDVDRDGDPDLVASTASGDDGPALLVRWYDNDGGSPPSFTERVFADVPSDATLDDLDGDGDLDVMQIVRLDAENVLLVLLENIGARGPKFDGPAASIPFENTTNLFSLTTDLDGDEDLDIVLWSESAGVWWLERLPGTFGTYAEPAQLLPPDERALAAADVDLDGDVDLLGDDGGRLRLHESGPAPIFVEYPADTLARGGMPVMLTCRAGDGALYQWRRNGVPLVNGPRISGAQSTTLTIAPPLLEDQGIYTCVATGVAGATVSEGALLAVMPCDGDVDGNGVIGVTDLDFLLNAWRDVCP